MIWLQDWFCSVVINHHDIFVYFCWVKCSWSRSNLCISVAGTVWTEPRHSRAISINLLRDLLAAPIPRWCDGRNTWPVGFGLLTLWRNHFLPSLWTLRHKLLSALHKKVWRPRRKYKQQSKIRLSFLISASAICNVYLVNRMMRSRRENPTSFGSLDFHLPEALQVSLFAWPLTDFLSFIRSRSHDEARRANHANPSLFFCLPSIRISQLASLAGRKRVHTHPVPRSRRLEWQSPEARTDVQRPLRIVTGHRNDVKGYWCLRQKKLRILTEEAETKGLVNILESKRLSLTSISTSWESSSIRCRVACR